MHAVTTAPRDDAGRRPAITRARDGFHHPSTEDELVALVRLARREGKLLRVRGSAHSVPGAIYTGARRDGPHVDVMLDRYTRMSFDDARMRVTVEAGCHLGEDPRDPTGRATWERSLLCKLEARGWALPDLGGVTHQTVSGFFMTGSSGGSVRHAVEDAVVGIRLIDGTGRVHDLERGRDELFDAAACSMGLLGVVSTVTLQCVPRYDLLGREEIRDEGDTAHPLYGDGDAGIEGFLRSTEYARLMWWPQRGVRRVVTWQAQRMEDADYGERTGPRGALRPKRYSPLGDGFTDERVIAAANHACQWAGGAFYDVMAASAARSAALTSRFPAAAHLAQRAREAFAERVLPPILRQFVPTSGPQEFWGPWCHLLPMDNAISDRALPTEFTEIWVPLDRAGEVMRALRRHYDRCGYDATGAFITELYAARAARAWMHPGYGRDSFRVDVFWFGRNREDPRRTLFPQFWELLRPFGYRLHWGKHLPRDPRLGAHHLRGVTPRWDDFLAARARLDPDNVFLTPYWREALDIAR
jgi:D-arabinono-1,4-lactone oxidase